MIDNIRDREFDAQKNERTLAVIIGLRWSRVEYVALIVLAYVIPIVMYVRTESALMLLPLVSIPYAIVVARQVLREDTHDGLIPMTHAKAKSSWRTLC